MVSLLRLREAPLDILNGMGEIQDPVEKWGHVTVEDLIFGAVNTYKKGGNKDVVEPDEDNMVDSPTLGDALKSDQMDIRRANLLRIPVCGSEEAKKNLEKGRKSYRDSPNLSVRCVGWLPVFRVGVARIYVIRAYIQ